MKGKNKKFKRVVLADPKEIQRVLDEGSKNNSLQIYGVSKTTGRVEKSVIMRELTIETQHAQRKLGVWFVSVEQEENEQLLHMLHPKS